jgi:hypothetical protein
MSEALNTRATIRKVFAYLPQQACSFVSQPTALLIALHAGGGGARSHSEIGSLIRTILAADPKAAFIKDTSGATPLAIARSRKLDPDILATVIEASFPTRGRKLTTAYSDMLRGLNPGTGRGDVWGASPGTPRSVTPDGVPRELRESAIAVANRSILTSSGERASVVRVVEQPYPPGTIVMCRFNQQEKPGTVAAPGYDATAQTYPVIFEDGRFNASFAAVDLKQDMDAPVPGDNVKVRVDSGSTVNLAATRREQAAAAAAAAAAADAVPNNDAPSVPSVAATMLATGAPAICSSGHALTSYLTPGGVCDGCGASVSPGTQVMDCRACNYYLCSQCTPLLPATGAEGGRTSSLVDAVFINRAVNGATTLRLKNAPFTEFTLGAPRPKKKKKGEEEDFLVGGNVLKLSVSVAVESKRKSMQRFVRTKSSSSRDVLIDSLVQGGADPERLLLAAACIDSISLACSVIVRYAGKSFFKITIFVIVTEFSSYFYEI